MKKFNNKGFTLVELLAVLVILIAIMSIAIPTINSSLERSKGSQDEHRKKLLVSAAELYVADYKNSLTDVKCISLLTLQDNGYVDKDAINDSNGDRFNGCIKKNNKGILEYSSVCSGCN